MTETLVEKTKKELEVTLESFFEDKIKDCTFDDFEDVKRTLENNLKETISNIVCELEYFDKETDNEIETMEEKREEIMMESLAKYHIYKLDPPMDSLFH